MAIEVYPGDIPKHDENQNNSVAPTTAIQDDGYPTSSEPPSSEHNFIFNRLLRAALSQRQKPVKGWLTATSYEKLELVINPDVPRKLYQANVGHTSTGTTLKENDLANWDVVSKSLNELLGPFVDGEMVVGDTSSGNLKKSTVVTEVGNIIVSDPGIINGNMQHWQVNTSVISAASGTHIADLFKYEKSGPQIHDLTRSTDAPQVSDGARAGANFSSLITVTTVNTGLDAGEITLLGASMEGLDFATYFGQTFTITFFVKSNVTGIYAIAFRNSDATRSFVSEYTIDVANTWEKKTITVTHNITGTWLLNEGLGIQVIWALAGGSTFQTTPGSWVNGNFITTEDAINFDLDVGNNFRLAQVSFNKGASGRDNLKPDTEELQRISRYFKVVNNVEYGFIKLDNNDKHTWNFQFQREMRAIPAAVQSGAVTVGGVQNPVLHDITPNGLSIDLIGISSFDEFISSNFTLTLDSRL